ncbi:MAG TPA: adenylate/guanylate cyclase domain-containing protein [Candidatus Acidoferrales bacterium]|nr:adenylate/guanylate cyclase domain-containing protein [Candidatus Acidoferrales bacterium]
MTCAACGADNRAGARFCVKCGASLERACPSCGASYTIGDDFCSECGARLKAAVLGRTTASNDASPAEQQRMAERRHVTVLFADLVGFTPLSQQRDAEDVRDLLSRYFDTARTIIARYGGTVEKFIGDAVMAVWGVPNIQENDAERAVRAALELVDAVAAFGEEAGVPGLRARAGVLTGEAAVNLGAGESMVAGDLVNTASRVQSAAQPGTVYVGDATRQATEAAIVYEDVGSHELKGKPEPERLWHALRVVAARGGALRPTGLEPPFVGRVRELRLLKEFLHATREEGKARLLSIVGLAGVGKSRLSWEFFKYVDGLTETVWWHRGRCLAYDEGVAYWALNEMVRMRAGIIENEAPESAREKLRRCVEEFVATPEERRWVEPRLAHLVGLEERIASDPRDLYAAWRFFFERLAAQDLTVLVFEDLQWADRGLLDFIEYLLEWSRNSPILVVTLARPELAERRPGWGTGKRGLTSLYLEPLSPEAMSQLLDGMVPGLPDDLSARIRERAAGVPLYAVETVRMLLDRGLLIEEGGTYRVEGSLESLEVPETLHALIAARLDSLGASERQLLQDAAVLGKSFTAAAVRAITAQHPDSVEPSLTSLVSKDLLAIQSDPRSPERGQYVFVQDLVRSVAYGTLARRDRKLRHLAAASYLESSWSEEEEVTEVVASHLLEAYNADADAEDAATIRKRARDALVRAGDHAASLAAAASAQHYYERALLLAEPSDKAALHAAVGEMAWLQLNASTARKHLDEAVALHTAAGRLGAAARVSVTLAEIDSHEMRRDQAAERMELAFAALSGADATEEGHEADLALVAAETARRLYLSERTTDLAMERVELALEIAERLGLTDVFCQAVNTKGLMLAGRGRRDEGRALIQCALDHALASNLHEAALRAYNNLAAQLQGSEPDTAETFTRAGAALAKLMGQRRAELMFTVGELPVLLDLGQWDAAIEAISALLESSEESMTGSDLGYELIYGVWVHLWRGEIGEARSHLERTSGLLTRASADYRAVHTAAQMAVLRAQGRDSEATVIGAEVFNHPTESIDFLDITRWVLIEVVELAFAAGDDAAVRRSLDSVSQRLSANRAPIVHAHIARFRARLAALEGREADVISDTRDAIDFFQRRQMPFWLAVSRLEFGEWLAARGRMAEATEQLTDARTTFESLRAGPWIDRVDNAEQARATSEQARPAV